MPAGLFHGHVFLSRCIYPSFELHCGLHTIKTQECSTVHPSPEAWLTSSRERPLACETVMKCSGSAHVRAYSALVRLQCYSGYWLGKGAQCSTTCKNSLECRRPARLPSAVEMNCAQTPPPPAAQSKKSLCDITEGTIPLPGWHQQLVTGRKEISLGDLRIISQCKYITNAWDVKQAGRRSNKANRVFCSKL